MNLEFWQALAREGICKSLILLRLARLAGLAGLAGEKDGSRILVFCEFCVYISKIKIKIKCGVIQRLPKTLKIDKVGFALVIPSPKYFVLLYIYIFIYNIINYHFASLLFASFCYFFPSSNNRVTIFTELLCLLMSSHVKQQFCNNRRVKSVKN